VAWAIPASVAVAALALFGIGAFKAHTTVGSRLREGLTLAAIWLTHHHFDHVGGVKDLVAKHPGIEVVAHSSDKERSPCVTKLVDEGDTVTLGALTAHIIYNPGHTLGAISFHVAGAVFTGDTLFGAGCGRVFEGNPEMMHASLQKLAALPEATQVYFGHEYTKSNLAFAKVAEPDNAAVAKRAANIPTPSTPSTIADERASNVFVRAADAATFADLRARKDTFKAS